MTPPTWEQWTPEDGARLDPREVFPLDAAESEIDENQEEIERWLESQS